LPVGVVKTKRLPILRQPPFFETPAHHRSEREVAKRQSAFSVPFGLVTVALLSFSGRVFCLANSQRSPSALAT
jgi:hypothetical protein